GAVARGTAGLLEPLLAAAHLLGDLAATGGGVVEQVPLGNVEVALGDLLAVAVAVGVVLADAGWAAHGAAVLAGGGDALQATGVRHLRKAVAFGPLVERGRVEGLQPRMDVERRGDEGADGRRDGRPEWGVQVAETEALHLERVAGHAGVTQAAGERDAL